METVLQDRSLGGSLLIAIAILVHALITWAARPPRPERDLRRQLEKHATSLETLLESEEGREAIARVLVSETSLYSLLVSVEESLTTTTEEPAVAAKKQAKKWNLRDLRAPKINIGEVAKTVLGKVNDYVKAQFGTK